MKTTINDPRNVYVCGPWFEQSSEERRKEFLHLGDILIDRGYYPFFPPFFTLNECPTREEYLKHALVKLLMCRHIYLMRGWNERTAEMFIYVTARFIGIPVLCDEGDFSEELDPCFPPERRHARTHEPDPSMMNLTTFEYRDHQAEDNEGFQEYYKNRVLPLFTGDSDTDTHAK